MKRYPIDKRGPRLRRFLPSLIAVCAGLLCLSAGIRTASANPSGATVVNGQVTFSWQGNVFTITNSPNAIINWDSFSIAPGEMTRFLQQSSNSAVLNRITGQSPSQILGALQSNGRVFLINPNGIIFGAGAQVNVAGLVASTLYMSDTDFLSGKNKFAAGNVAGDVINQGVITTPSGGQIFLIAPNVTNTGIITSPEGEVLLAAGHSVQLADSSNPSLHVVVSSATDQAINLGQVIAQGGKVGIYGALVNQRGTVNANSAVVGANGKIVLKSTGTTLLEAGSVTTATGAGNGGEINVLGNQVGLMGDAQVDASGQTGGGTILIGGDFQGKNPNIANAQQTYVGKAAKITADAIVSGNGGKVIVWGDKTSQAYGRISARGGALSGNGGLIETSGHVLDVAGIRVDASAPHGAAGEWLLDPMNITIVEDLSATTPLGDASAFATNPDSNSVIAPHLISEADGVVVLQATNQIDFRSAINNGNPNASLVAQAGNNIILEAEGNIQFIGNITLAAHAGGPGIANGNGNIDLSHGVSAHSTQGVVIMTDATTQAAAAAAQAAAQAAAASTAQAAAAQAAAAVAANKPPSADICTIAPNSALCQVLSPPTASEPVKPVQQASNEIIKTVTTSTPKTDFDQVAFLDTKKTTPSTSDGGSSGTTASSGSTTTGGGSSTPDDSKTADKAADKSDTKEVAATDKTGTKNEPAKKMYCN